MAETLFDEKLELAARYRALPDLVVGLKRQGADAATHRGVALDKLGDRAGAESAYRRALALAPLSETEYDLAVLFWGRDWAEAERHLQEAVRLDPANAAAAKSLAALRTRPR